MRVAIIFIFIGIALWGYSYTLNPYQDEALFNERYMKLSSGQSEEYWKLREEMLTPKYKLQDYGITLLAISPFYFMAMRSGRVLLLMPKTRKPLFTLGVVLPILTVGGYVFDIFQGFNRGEFPHWADTLAIPLGAAPVELVLLIVWAAAHLLFLRGSYHPSISLVRKYSLKLNLASPRYSRHLAALN